MKQSHADYVNQSIAIKPQGQRVSIVFSLISQTLFFLALAFTAYVIVVNIQFRQVVEDQTDALGRSLVEQTTERVTELLTIDDKLGLNIVLGNLARNPLVANVTIFDSSDKELYRAGLKQVVHDEDLGSYCKPIVIQQHDSGKLCLNLDMRQFKAPWIVSIERTIIIAVGLLLIGLVFSFRLGRRIITPIMQLREWVRNPTMPAPCVDRTDELGSLAYDLQSKLIAPEDIDAYYAKLTSSQTQLLNELDIEAPISSVSDSIDTSQVDQDLLSNRVDDNFLKNLCSLEERNKQDYTNILAMNEALENVPVINDMVPETILPEIQTAVLCIRLGAQEQLQRLPKERLMKLLQRYRDCLNYTVHLYRGEIHTLNDGSSLVLFHGRGSETESYVLHAICCGELMRALSHELQLELVDTQIVLLLQMVLAKGSHLLGLTLSELAENETVQAAQSLAEHSRNLLLLDHSMVDDTYIEKLARIRSLANPSGTYCIERVLEPYAEILEKQLRNMRNNQL